MSTWKYEFIGKYKNANCNIKSENNILVIYKEDVFVGAILCGFSIISTIFVPKNHKLQIDTG